MVRPPISDLESVAGFDERGLRLAGRGFDAAARRRGQANERAARSRQVSRRDHLLDDNRVEGSRQRRLRAIGLRAPRRRLRRRDRGCGRRLVLPRAVELHGGRGFALGEPLEAGAVLLRQRERSLRGFERGPRPFEGGVGLPRLEPHEDRSRAHGLPRHGADLRDRSREPAGEDRLEPADDDAFDLDAARRRPGRDGRRLELPRRRLGGAGRFVLRAGRRRERRGEQESHPLHGFSSPSGGRPSASLRVASAARRSDFAPETPRRARSSAARASSRSASLASPSS